MSLKDCFNLKLMLIIGALLVHVFSVPLLFPSIEEKIEESENRGGFRYLKNYSPTDYNFNPQNWCILQDKRGLIYVGNNAGLLEFDGVSWESASIPHWTVRSMTIYKNGTIYIGGNSEIGFVAREVDGSLRYFSLLEKVHKDKRNFGNVWKTHAAEEGIYFFTTKYLFRWNPQRKKMRVWESELNINFDDSFVCNGKFFVHQRRKGLKQMENNVLKLIPGEETFASVKIYMMVPYDDDKLLIGTRSNGFFLYDGRQAVPFHTEADEYLKKNQLYYGIRLSSSPGQFALATRRGGLLVIDSRGKLKNIFNTSSGLQVNNVKHVFEDYQGNLWLALVKGISKIEYASPFSIYDDRSNLPELVLSVVKHHNGIYAGTTSGLYFIASPFSGTFRHVRGISANCWSLLSTGDSVLAATTHGVFEVSPGNNSIRKVIDSYSNYLHPSPGNPNRIWVGMRHGLASLYLSSKGKNQNRWIMESQLENVNENIITIVEERKGNLWLGTLTEGVLKVDFPVDGTGATVIKPNNTAHKVTRYDKLDNLLCNEVHVFKAAGAGGVMFATRRGIFRFNDKTGEFFPDTSLGEEFSGGEKGSGVFRIAEDRYKNIWFHSGLRNFQAIANHDGTYTINKKVFLRLPQSQVNTIYPDADGNNIWFAGNYGLTRYDKTAQKDLNQSFLITIRQAAVNGIPRIYEPNASKYKTPHGKQNSVSVFPYSDRNLRFQFAALFFEGEPETQYQHFLQGYDKDWSAWDSKTIVEYTNLDSGSYTFRVQAKNVYGNLSSEAVFQFKVLPPFYKTWWAFTLYAIAAFLGVFFIVKWRSGKLEREKQRLEQTVKERTTEINEKNIQLESHTIQLKEQSEKLKGMDKIKSRFFANISHEFRTPLTLLIGPLEQMIAACGDDEKEKKRKYIMMLRNAQRLLRLINQLLELSKLDSGKMKLQAVKTEIVPFIKGIISSFQLLAQQNELDLVFQTGNDMETGEMLLYIDPRKMEDVMSNLLINAVKFTPAGGKISITLNKNKLNRSFCGGEGGGFLEKSPLPAGGKYKTIEISVRDTGPGIPIEQLAHIFDRFYQAESTYEYHQKGSGIGLALSKELVELHHGTIEAISSEGEGEGSEFIIRLPVGNAHLAPDEMGKISAKKTKAGMGIEKEDGIEDDSIYDLESEAESGEKNIILVVEDSADMRAYIRQELEPGYTVVEAEDGGEGIQKARDIIPDLIVSDVMMPGVDGYELCRVLKTDVKTSHVPIIMLTAKASEENIIHGLETGADDYVTKPFSTKILLARVKNLIDIRKQLQKNINREMTLQPVKTSVSKIDQEFLRDLQTVIKENLSEPEFNVEDLCKRLYMGNTTLYRKIQALCGQTPTEFIRTCRLKRAAQLLKEGFGSVTEVAFEVGFSSRTYFTKCFKERFNQLPSSFASGGQGGSFEKRGENPPWTPRKTSD